MQHIGLTPSQPLLGRHCDLEDDLGIRSLLVICLRGTLARNGQEYKLPVPCPSLLSNLGPNTPQGVYGSAQGVSALGSTATLGALSTPFQDLHLCLLWSLSVTTTMAHRGPLVHACTSAGTCHPELRCVPREAVLGGDWVTVTGHFPLLWIKGHVPGADGSWTCT